MIGEDVLAALFSTMGENDEAKKVNGLRVRHGSGCVKRNNNSNSNGNDNYHENGNV